MKKHSLVVGGTRGLGRAVVKALSQEGHVVSVIGRRPPQESDSAFPDVHYWLTDLADRERLLEVAGEIISKKGPLNDLIFCQRYRGPDDSWTGEIQVSLSATKTLIDRLSDEFAESGGKSIVVVSSVASRLVAEEQPLSYHVAKAALDHLVRYYAVSLGPREVRVNSVCPGAFIKEGTEKCFAEEPLTSSYRRIIPLARRGTADEVAKTILFLCSSSASFVTGQNIVVDGGASLRLQESVARELQA